MSELTAKGSAIDDLPDMWDGFMRMVRDGHSLREGSGEIMGIRSRSGWTVRSTAWPWTPGPRRWMRCGSGWA